MPLQLVANRNKSKVVIESVDQNIEITTDQEKISEVIYNLVDNAVKYGKEEQTITVSVTSDANQNVTFSVRDQGKGITDDKISKLFGKFSQLEPSLRRSQDGTGLGLYICKLIVEKLGGKIDVESEIGRGSRFFFTLPREFSGDEATL